jgi:hypothetical protein
MSRLKHDEGFGEPSVTNICDSDSWSRVMIIIIGLVILVAAVVVGVAGLSLLPTRPRATSSRPG